MSSRNIICKSILAGVAIGLGGTAYLSIDNHVIGALIFSLGLLVICYCDFYLFTGKLCFITKLRELIVLSHIFIWNWVGTSIVALIVAVGRPALMTKADILCAAKLEEGWRVIPLGILCNVLIFFAVLIFNKTMPAPCLILVLCVMAFILCGFEHSIANVFYFSLSRENGCVYILLNALGNFIGGFGAVRLFKGGANNE